jgi:hypothetical protein
MASYVVYSSDVEVIITTLKDEHIVLKEYFKEGNRVLDDYDRKVQSEPVCIRTSFSLD